MCVPERLRGIAICDWKGRGEVSKITIMDVQSNDHNRGSTSSVWNENTVL